MYENYYFIPLDIPRLEFDRERLLDFYDEKKIRLIDPVSEPLGNPWNIVWLWDRGDTIFQKEISALFVNLYEVFNHLPHKYINNIALIEQVLEVKAHSDVSKETDTTLGPSSYRCMLINDEPNKTFYFREGIRWEGTLQDKEIYPTMPKTTNFFAINNYNAMHGSHMPTKRKILLTVWGKVDQSKHYDLLQRSVKKYEEFCLKCNSNQN